MPGAVAGFRIAAASAAMHKVLQDLQALQDDVVRRLAVDVDDEANSAGVVFVGGIVKTLSGGQLVRVSTGYTAASSRRRGIRSV